MAASPIPSPPILAPPYNLIPNASPRLTGWQKTDQIFRKIINSPYFWATLTIAACAIVGATLIGLLHSAPIFLFCAVAFGPLCLGITIHLLESRSSLNHLRIAAHVLGGAGIKKAKVKGVELEGASINESTTALLAFLESSPEKIKEHPLLIGSLKQLLYFDGKLSMSKKKFAKFVSSSIASMKIGETLTLPGGWIGKSGHAMLFHIKRDGKDSFSLTTINTGGGIDNHSSKKVGDKIKYAPTHSITNINLTTICSTPTWEIYHKLQSLEPIGREDRGFDRSSAFIYNHFLTRFQNASTHISSSTDYITPQKAGTCANDVLFALMRSLTGNVPRYKQIKNQYKWWVINKHLTPEVAQLKKEALRARDPKQIMQILGRAKLLGHLLARFAKSIHKALKKGEGVTLEEGEKYLKSYNELHQTLQEIKSRSRKELVALSVERPQGKLLQLSLPSVSKEPQEKTAKLDQTSDRSCFEVEIETTWGEPAHLLTRLEGWVKTLKPLLLGHATAKKEAHLHLQMLFANMPNASDLFWTSIMESSEQEKKRSAESLDPASREAILVNIAELHEWFYMTASYAEIGGRQRPVDRALIEKNTDLISQLSLSLIRNSSRGMLGLISSPSIIEAMTFPFPEESFHHSLQIDELLLYTNKTEPHSRKCIYSYNQLFKFNPFGEDLNVSFYEHLCADGSPNFFATAQLIYDNLAEKHKEEILKIVQSNPKMLGIHRHYAMVTYALVHHKKYLPRPFSIMIHAAGIHFINQKRTYNPNQRTGTESKTCRLPQIFYKFAFNKISIGRNTIQAHTPIPLIATPDHSSIEIHRTSPLSQTTVERLHRIEDFSKMSQNSIAVDRIEELGELDGDLEIPSFDKKLCMALAKDVDISHRAGLLINLYASDLNRLTDPEEQFIFERLIFTHDLLREALLEGPFAPILSDFVHQGTRFARDAEEIPTELFFLRLGSFFNSYTKGSVPFPNLIEQTTPLLKNPRLTDAHKALILQERLAHRGRSQEPLSLAICKEILEEQTALQSLEIPTAYQDFKLNENIERLAYKVRQFIKGKSKKEINEVTTGIFKGKAATLALPYIYSDDQEYVFNLLTSQLFQRGVPGQPLPKDLKESKGFRQCFITNEKSTVKEVFGGFNHAHFKDRFDNPCRATKDKKGNWEIRRTLEGRRYQYVGFSGEQGVPESLQCSIWKDHQGRVVLFDENTGRISYRYTKQGLTCILEEERHGLFLAKQEEKKPFQNFFRSFDDKALFWRDSKASTLRLIELPSYDLKIRHHEGKYLLSKPYKGYEWDPKTYLPRLAQVPGILVIKKGRERKVLIPQKKLKTKDSQLESYDQELQFEESATQFDEYTLTDEGRLTPASREASLHLAYLYLTQRNYQEALMLLKETPHLAPLTEKEISWFEAIHATSSRLSDPRANAIQLFIKLWRLNNINSTDTEKEMISIEAEVESYFNNFSELPADFIIPRSAIKKEVSEADSKEASILKESEKEQKEKEEGRFSYALPSLTDRFTKETRELFREVERKDREEKEEGEKKISADSLSARFKAFSEHLGEDLVAQEALKELESDVKAFQSTHKATSYHPTRPEALVPLITKSQEEIQRLREEEAKLKIAIETLGNKTATAVLQQVIDQLKRGAKLSRSLKIDDFLISYLKGTPTSYKECNPNLLDIEAQTLHEKIGLLLLLSTERQRLERYHKALEQYHKTASSPSADSELLNEYAQTIINEATATRHYNIEEHPEYLIFEYKRHLALREEQVEGLKALLDSRAGNRVLQLIMGAGKTDIMAILLAIKKANGKNISIMLAPEELMPDFSKNIETQGRMFKKEVRRINWEDTSTKNLKAIYKELLEIRETKKVLIAKNEEIKHFLLAAQQALLGEEDVTRLESFRQIKKLLLSSGDATFDEIHKEYSRHDSRIAAGSLKKIDTDYFRISLMLYKNLIHLERISSKVHFEFSPKKTPGSELFTPALFKTIQSTLLEATLKELSELYPELGTAQEHSAKEILEFITAPAGSSATLPNLSACVPDPNKRKKVEQIFCFLKGQQEILPETLSKRLNERYGLFPTTRGAPSFLAGPFKSANTPNFGSQFGNYIELINYTIQANLNEVPLEAFKEEIKRIQALRQREIESSTRLEDSVALKEYRLLVGDAFVEAHPITYKTLHDSSLTEWLSELNQVPAFRHHFIEHYILPTIQPQANVLVCDAQNLFSAFQHTTGYTGTPKEELSLKFDVIKSKGTDGQVIALIEKNSKNDQIILREAETAEEQLRTLLLQPNKEQFYALIDAGALFKDIAPKWVAQIILANRPDINAVTYYEESPEGPIEKMMRRDGGADETVHSVDPQHLFVFFGQNQCTGINKHLPQRAHALLTTNPGITYTQLAQGAMRMRGLAKGQRIHLVVPESLEALIKKKWDKEAIDSVDYCLFAKLIEAQKEADDNLLNVRQQMRQIVLKAIQGYLDSIPLETLKAPQHRALAQLLVTKTAIDPLIQFGKIDQVLDLETALNTFASQALEGLKAWHKEYAGVVNRDYASLISAEALKKEIDDRISEIVKANRVKRRFKPRVVVAAVGDRGSEVAVKTETQKKTEQEQKTELEMEEKTNSHVQPYTDSPLINPSELRHLSAFEIGGDDLSKTIPIKLLNDKIHQPELFSPNLYISEDFAQTATHCAPFERYYKPVSVCLIRRSIRDPSKVQMILLTPREARKMEMDLQELPANENFEYCLYYPMIDYAFPRPLAGLKEERNFQTLCMQYLVLAGARHIPPKYQTLMEAWTKEMAAPLVLQKFYLKAMAKEQQLIKAYHSSYLKELIVRYSP